MAEGGFQTKIFFFFFYFSAISTGKSFRPVDDSKINSVAFVDCSVCQCLAVVISHVLVCFILSPHKVHPPQAIAPSLKRVCLSLFISLFLVPFFSSKTPAC